MIMETIRLEFQPSIKAKILEVLSSFSSDELKIVQEDPNFEENKKELEIAYAKIHEVKCTFNALFDNTLDMGLIGSDNLDLELLSQDGFEYSELI